MGPYGLIVMVSTYSVLLRTGTCYVDIFVLFFCKDIVLCRNYFITSYSL